MKELNIMEATVLTSPNPLTLICSQNEDGTTNLAPICFVSYLSFNPPMVGFAAGQQSHTGQLSAALHPIGIRKGAPQHLIAAADAQHGSAPAGMLEHFGLQPILTHQFEVIHRAFGARKDHKIRISELPRSAHIAHRYS